MPRTRIEWRDAKTTEKPRRSLSPNDYDPRADKERMPPVVKVRDLHVALKEHNTILTFDVDAYLLGGGLRFSSALKAVNGNSRGSTEHIPVEFVERAHNKARLMAASQITEL